MSRTPTHPRLILSGAVAAIGALLFVSQCRGQAAWEYTPYEIRVRLALEPTPELPAAALPRLAETIANRSAAVLGAIWHVETGAASPKLRNVLLYAGRDAMSDDIVAASPAAELATDKLYLTAVRRGEQGYGVIVREFDCRTRQVGPPVERTANGIESLPLAVWDALAASFTPLARIEHVEQSRVVARLRAGGLATSPQSPALIEAGSALRPVVRRNDRGGQPAQGGIQTPPWTVLTVNSREDALLDCTLQSGYRNPIPARGGVRIDRLALAIRPRYETTQLVLRSRTDPQKPLVGYEIHTRAPGSEETQPLGLTDAHGAFELPPSTGGVQMLYVRNGRQLLARLPIVPGQADSITASIVDDDNRLAAEGFIAALANRALDLVARREILAARIRARLKSGQVADAQNLLDDFRKLQTRADLSRDLDQFRQRVITRDSLTQQRIDKLFADAQKLLLMRPLSDDLLGELTREVAAKRAASVQSSEFKAQS